MVETKIEQIKNMDKCMNDLISNYLDALSKLRTCCGELAYYKNKVSLLEKINEELEKELKAKE